MRKLYLVAALMLATQAPYSLAAGAPGDVETYRPGYLREGASTKLLIDTTRDACIAAHIAVAASRNYPGACEPYYISEDSLFSTDPDERNREFGFLMAIQLFDMSCRGVGHHCDKLRSMRRQYYLRFVR